MSSESLTRFNKANRVTVGILAFVATELIFASGPLGQSPQLPNVQLDPRFEQALKLEQLLLPPPPPILISPDDNAVRGPGLNRPDNLTFYWKVGAVPTGGVTNYRFNLCRQEPNAEVCDPPVILGANITQYSPAGGLSAMIYQGRIMRWWVGGCRTTVKERCAASGHRTLSWPLPAPAWQDIPVAGVNLPVPVIYNKLVGALWTQVYGADVGYLVCIGTSVAQCPQTGTNFGVDPFVKHTTSVGIEIPLTELTQFKGRTVKVKLAACTNATPGPIATCVYQTDYRPIQIPQ